MLAFADKGPPVKKKVVSLENRAANIVAMIDHFIAENDLSLSLAPKLLSLAKALSMDRKALNEVKLSRNAATYKLIHGIHSVDKKRLVHALKHHHFSMNIDESTTKSSKKRILNILVCYFDESLSKSVTHIYACVEMFTVNATTVYEAVTGLFERDGIPMANLVSILSDSAAYMRGCKNGFQQKMKTGGKVEEGKPTPGELNISYNFLMFYISVFLCIPSCLCDFCFVCRLLICVPYIITS